MVDFDRRRLISSDISEGGRKKKREKKRRTWRFLQLIRRPQAISSLRTGRRNVSSRGEKERGDVTRSIPICTAWYVRYISVCQVTGTRIARYRAVSPKSTVGGRFRPSMVDFGRWQSIEGEEERRKKKEEEKKKEYLASSSPAC
ncbi:hypothetical protein BHE74_00030157, partial [Ensete ventricosum]